MLEEKLITEKIKLTISIQGAHVVEKENHENFTHTQASSVRLKDFIIRFLLFYLSFLSGVSKTLRQKKNSENYSSITLKSEAVSKKGIGRMWTSLFFLNLYKIYEKSCFCEFFVATEENNFRSIFCWSPTQRKQWNRLKVGWWGASWEAEGCDLHPDAIFLVCELWTGFRALFNDWYF